MTIQTAGGPVFDSGEAAPLRWHGGLRRFGRVAGLAVVLAILAVIFGACGGGPGGTSGGKVDLAPNFSFTLFQGEDKLGAKEMDVAQLQGKPVVLNFWAGLCPPCRAEMPDLQLFYEEFKDRVTLVGIDLGQFTGLGSTSDAVSLLQELDVTYPAGFTEDVSVIPKYKVLGMPTTVFIDADGAIFKTWTGALNRSVLEEQTNAMLSQ